MPIFPLPTPPAPPPPACEWCGAPGARPCGGDTICDDCRAASEFADQAFGELPE